MVDKHRPKGHLSAPRVSEDLRAEAIVNGDKQREKHKNTGEPTPHEATASKPWVPVPASMSAAITRQDSKREMRY